MPQRSKRSKAASARNEERSKVIYPNDRNHNNQNKGLTRQSHIDLDDMKISYISIVKGNFNQGDEQFSAESRGVQCSCNALVMLCQVQTIFNNIRPYHLDNILQDGDKLYKNSARELQACGQLARNGYFYHDQLPTNVVIRNTSFIINYDELRYGTLDECRESIFEPLHVELPVAFTVSERNILILGGSMMALYKDTTSGQYLFFDSHSRNASGFPDCDGTSCAIIFPNINNLVKYLQALVAKMNLDLTNFAILPLKITTEQTHRSHIQNLHNQNEKEITTCITVADTTATTNDSACRNQISSIGLLTMTCLPETETLQSDCKNSSLDEINKVNKLSNRRNRRRMSRYQKWLLNQPISKREDLLGRKRKLSNDDYQIPGNATKKRKEAKSAYQNPKNAQRKRQQARQAYQDPKNAQKKRLQARHNSKTAYQDPKKGQMKRQKARHNAKTAYQDPKKGQMKRQKARHNSKTAYQDPKKGQMKRQKARQSYQDPKNAQKKRLQARHNSKTAYQDPKKGQMKRQKARQSYQDPKNAQRKRQQARHNSKTAYQDPKNSQRKCQQARQAYQDPEIRAIKIKQSQSNRSQRQSNIETVITNFKKSCKDSQQLIYIYVKYVKEFILNIRDKLFEKRSTINVHYSSVSHLATQLISYLYRLISMTTRCGFVIRAI